MIGRCVGRSHAAHRKWKSIDRHHRSIPPLPNPKRHQPVHRLRERGRISRSPCNTKCHLRATHCQVAGPRLPSIPVRLGGGREARRQRRTSSRGSSPSWWNICGSMSSKQSRCSKQSECKQQLARRTYCMRYVSDPRCLPTGQQADANNGAHGQGRTACKPASRHCGQEHPDTANWTCLHQSPPGPREGMLPQPRCCCSHSEEVSQGPPHAPGMCTEVMLAESRGPMTQLEVTNLDYEVTILDPNSAAATRNDAQPQAPEPNNEEDAQHHAPESTDGLANF